MFERRLKIFLLVIVVISLVLIGRVFDVQVVAHSYWKGQAVGLLTRPQYTETTRGPILDLHGKVMAIDIACTDACVDYRAIIDPPNPAWVKELAVARLRAHLGTDYTRAKADKKVALQADEIKAVKSDIGVMWETLAQLNRGRDPAANTDPHAAMEQIRATIIQEVQYRRQKVAEQNQKRQQARQAKSSKWFKWLASASDDDGAADNLATIAEQEEPHVVLPNLDSEACNFLDKHLDQLPGLSLRPSTHRSYPLHTILSNAIGRMTGVSASDLDQSGEGDELRQYRREDKIGREGIEALCEPLLRGSRGRIEKRISDGTIVSSQDFVPGGEVRLSIDTDLQAQVQQMLQHVEISGHDEQNNLVSLTPPGGVSMHAAAVVLDVQTNEVRVLASNPGFDADDLQEKYVTLLNDKVDEPLRDRATSDEVEPGSTVKPLIGLGAITQGILGPTDTIECTGYLYLPEVGPGGKIRRVKMPAGRCWVLSEFGPQLKQIHSDGSHHPFPSSDPHPTGFLTFADAIERSCDIYFETVADRLTPAGVDRWYDQFGMGRVTGIGIYERPGLRPQLWKGHPPEDPRMNNCWAGMGQGFVWATPLQIANEAATIARNGVWMRPRLLTAETQAALDAVHPRSSAIPDQVDLHLDPEALRQVKIGMVKVVDGKSANPKINHPAWLTVAAKTGTADTSPLLEKVKVEDGPLIRQKMIPVYHLGPETATPWYRATSEEGKPEHLVHAWYMGFAPVENPKIAFCVLIEYSGASGGAAAGPVAGKIIEACVKAGYLRPDGGAMASR
jgi:penicillin-binding protein 2